MDSLPTQPAGDGATPPVAPSPAPPPSTRFVARFFDGNQAQPHAVHVAAEGGLLLITSETGDVAERWPIPMLKTEQTPDGSIAVRPRTSPARLFLPDASLLPTLGLRPRRSAARPMRWGAALAILVASIGGAILAVESLPDLAAPLIPLAWEDPLGAAARAALLASHKPCTAPEGQAAFDRLAATLAAQGHIRGDVHLTVIDDKTTNAFALPGNRIIVLRGLIDSAADGDEVAGVIAHEFGHLAHRDPIKGIIRQFGLGALAATLGWNGSGSGEIAETLIRLAYGRRAEAEADAFSIDVLRRAGLRANGLAHFFAHLPAHDISGIPTFLSDHPPTAERLERTQQPPDGAPAFPQAEWQAIRTMCASPLPSREGPGVGDAGMNPDPTRRTPAARL